jgi:tetratricopeptide (TPR) repeat protein
MKRAIALAVVVGMVVASGIAYAVRSSAWRDTVAQRIGTPDRQAEASIKSEDWPICTTMSPVETEADWAQLEPDFMAGKKALNAGDWQGAIAAFEIAAVRDPSNADIQNYIGYAYRRLRQLGPAMGHYHQALVLNPRHRSAREHLGEAYLVLGEPAKAEQLLAELESLCLIPCEEYEDLKRAIAAYRKLAVR